MTKAIDDVLAERQRQRDIEGWTDQYEDSHGNHEMALAAACHAYSELTTLAGVKIWPWAHNRWKPTGQRTNYVRAAALLLAEIERLDRQALPG